MQAALGSIIGPAGPEKADLTGKVALVTGGALGIGYEVSRHLALYGAHVYMLNRKEEQGNDAIESIKKEAKEQGKDAKIEWVGPFDLGTLSETKKVLDELIPKLDRLDYLILSAGINTNQYGQSADGLDRHFEVNALGHYYTINQLYPLMRKTSKMAGTKKGSVRIVFESSEMHRFAPSSQDSAERGRGVHFGSEEEITEGAKEYGPVELYGRTKLAMILYTKSLLNKVITKNGDDIYVSSVHPGTVATDMQEQWQDSYPGLKGTLIKWVTYAGSRSPEQGSYSALYAALSDEVVEKGWNGVYFSDPATLGSETAQASDLNLAQALWELSERIVVRLLGKDALKSWSE